MTLNICAMCFQRTVPVMTCPVCYVIFKRRVDFKYHLRGMHKIGEPITCYKCGMTFQSNSTRHRHSRKCPASILQTETTRENVSPAHESNNVENITNNVENID